MISLDKDFGDLQALFNYTKFNTNFLNIEDFLTARDAYCVMEIGMFCWGFLKNNIQSNGREEAEGIKM